jgi:predicted component of type VI protein secretion system
LHDQDFQFYQWLFNLSGQRINAEAPSLIGLSPLLVKRQMNTASLVAMVEYLLKGIKVSCQPFQLKWFKVSHDSQAYLSNRLTCLSDKKLIGSRVIDANHHFEICLSDVSIELFLQLIPGEKLAHLLASLLKAYVPPFYDFTLKIRVKVKQMKMRLGEPNLLLGWLCPLGQNFSQSSVDIYFTGQRYLDSALA